MSHVETIHGVRDDNRAGHLRAPEPNYRRDREHSPMKKPDPHPTVAVLSTVCLLALCLALPARAHNGAVALAVPVDGITVDGDAALTINEFTDLLLNNGEAGNTVLLSVDDVDNEEPGGGVLKATIAVTKGTLRLTTVDDLTALDGSDLTGGGATLVFEGLAADLNTA